MNIRIITFHRANNCGAVLQAYALSTFLANQGHNVKIVDYCPKWVSNKKVCVGNLLRNITIKRILMYPRDILRDLKFKSFVKKYCNITSEVVCAEDIPLNDHCDIYITGSDQVWNSEITEGLDSGYLLDFMTDAKKMSYAASCGWENYDDIDRIVEAVNSFVAISVRERHLAEALINNGVRNVVSVWDPVFLLCKEEYLKLQKKLHYKDYVLIYTQQDSEEVRVLAKRIAEQEKLRIVDTSKMIKKWPADYVCTNYGPLEFLGLLANADYIVTNSFHGTAFSIIFRRNFYSLDAGNRTVRLRSLLEDIEMEQRLISKSSEVETICSIDYDSFESKINSHIMQSKKFLLENCDGIS